MCSMSVLCPLCAQTSFTSIDALRNSLIKAANGPLSCPICNEFFLGLDKLTIHLFSHTNLMTHSITKEEKKNLNENNSTASSSPIQKQQLTNTNETMNNLEKKSKKSKENSKNAIKCKEKQEMEIICNNKDNITAVVNMEQTEFISNSISTQQQQQNNTTIQATTTTTNETEELSICDICEFAFRNEQLRDMHFRLVHQNSPTPSATSIKSTATGNNTNLISTQPDFKCHLCAKTFKMKGSLRVHLKVVHFFGYSNNNNNNNNAPKLNICNRIRFKEAKSKSSTNNLRSSPQQQQQMISNSNNNIKQTQLNSPNLLKSQSNSPQLQNLMVLTTQQLETEHHLPLTSQINGNLLQNFDTNLLTSNLLLVYTPPTASGEFNKDLLNKPTLDNPKIWECDVCSKSFTTKYFLKKHKRLHTGEMPYTCEICARTFTFQQSYHKHLLYHSDEKPHICATCGRAFKELSTLHNHERIHSGEKPFKCEICGKCFRQRVSFLVHTRIHTGVMPYSCEQCQKNFRYKVSLRTHKCIPSNEAVDDTSLTLTATTAQNQFENTNEFSNEHMTEKFLKAYLESNNNENQQQAQNSPASMEIAAINNADSCVEALLSKTIDDIVFESCNKMGIGNENNGTNNINLNSPQDLNSTQNLNSPQVQLTPSPTTLNGFSDGSNSALQKLQDMRLSPKFDLEINSNDNNHVVLEQMFFK